MSLPITTTGTTTIPMFIVKHLNVKPGDLLDWNIEVVKDNTVVVVRKAKK